jgi:hypothetical protein
MNDPTGITTLNYHNGDHYVGQVEDDCYHGVGTYKFANGAEYVGEFLDNHYHPNLH